MTPGSYVSPRKFRFTQGNKDMSELQQTNAELVKDKERLDWCEEHSDELWKILHMLLPGEDLRKAIDDARIKVS